ncbi:FAD/NAD(P)-binding domain-containing protein [Rhizodiscina lignyota]|uniref:FAD/NAD(P)-binding domain-containing protein n=1 Tax=Rhizodiscina lignyota TaxID=1504668 RepID=A0A9P4M465_9PEZI|nr:FAD/NAD(P)-binding domain-containing protein [Rhizodiscina lignyota]
MSSESTSSINDSSSRPLNVAIIGGGIGGLSLLIGLLHNANLNVIKPHIYEAAAKFSEIGAGVGFGPNAIESMRVVSPEFQQRFFAMATDADPEVVNGVEVPVWNEMRMGMDGKSEKCPLKAGDVITKVCFSAWKKNVHRAHFLDEMVSMLPGGTGEGFVTFGKRCTDIQDGEGGKGVVIKFADGMEAEADAVIGCDGVKSRVRPILLRKIGDEEGINPRFSGKYAYRGLIPIDEAVATIGDVAKRSHMWYGYDGHFVCFPFDGKWESQDWVLPATVEEALEDFVDWPDNIRKMVQSLQKPDKWMLFEHPPAKSYCDEAGKICLLGDCAHASTPHHGAGAGMAIEDSAVLSRLLGALEQPDPRALAAAFRSYDTARRVRTQKLVTTSRDAALLYEFQTPGILDDIEKVRKNVQERLRWIWDLDVEQHCMEAVNRLKEEVKLL